MLLICGIINVQYCCGNPYLLVCECHRDLLCQWMSGLSGECYLQLFTYI